MLDLAMKTIQIFISMTLVLFSITTRADDPFCHEITEDIEGLEIGQINIFNQDIFDKNIASENATIHRVTNELHWKTNISTIKQQLLFSQGQAYSQQLIDETVRKLRSKNYLHSVMIYAQKICNNKVDIIVKTTDNWTLTPSISFGRSGGINRSAYEISESNLFGLGKEVKLKSESNEDRDSQFVQYIDDSLFGSRYKLSIKKADNSDGYFNSLVFGKPYFQLDSRRSLLMKTFKEQKQVASYSRGKIINETGQFTEHLDIGYGWSGGLHGKQVLRYSAGLKKTDKQFFNTQEYPNTRLPLDKKVRYPYLGIQYLEDNYIKRENFNVMGVIEDIAIGHTFSVELGLINKSWGSTSDGFNITSNYSVGFDINANSLAFIDLGLISEINKQAEDFNAFSFSGKWLHYKNINNSYLLKAEYQVADNLVPIDQYVIGGDTGLRGYPIRFQTGNTKALLSAEKRSYLKWYPWKLVKFGIAVFADVGSAWKNNESANFISDIGFGLRLVSTRQSDSKVLHLDFAYPLDEQDKVDSFQLLINAKSQF